MINRIRKDIDDGKNVFITGPAGTGKTYILNQIRKEYSCAITASTGISALNINGQTLHSFFSITPAYKSIDDLKKWKNIDARKKDKIKAKLDNSILVIDEISMIDAPLFELIDGILKALGNKKQTFGGYQTIIVGDFFQLPPVKITPEEKANLKFAFESKVWKELDLSIHSLNENKRQSDPEFFNWLSKLRMGDNSKELLDYFAKIEKESKSLKDETKLFARSLPADKMNEEQLKLLPGKEYTFTGTHEVNIESLATKDLSKVYLAPYELKLKVNAKVLMLNNDVQGRWKNGSIGHVSELRENTIVVTFNNGKRFYVDKITWDKRTIDETIIETYEQYPLKLAWAITIHKSQGMTLSELEVNCDGIFEEGQLYVALSRVEDKNNLKLIGFNKFKIKANKVVKDFYINLIKN